MLTPIVQNDERLNEDIRKSGCLFRSLSMLAEIRAGKTMTVDQILAQYNQLVSAGAMRSDCYVLDHAAVIRSAQSILGSEATAKYVFRIEGEDNNNFDTGHRANAFIGHGKTNNGYGHFYVVQSDRNLLFDPYWPRPMIVKNLTFRGYFL